MKLEEKLELLETMLELDEGTLTVEMKLADIEEWDSFSKLYLVSWVKKNMQERLTVKQVNEFLTVEDICNYIH